MAERKRPRNKKNSQESEGTVESGTKHVADCFMTFRSRSSVGPWARDNKMAE